MFAFICRYQILHRYTQHVHNMKAEAKLYRRMKTNGVGERKKIDEQRRAMLAQGTLYTCIKMSL